MFFLDYKHSKPNTTTILLFSPLGHKQFEKFPTFWPYSDKKNHCKHIILSHISSQEVCTMFSCVYLYTPMLYPSYDNIHLKGIPDMKSYWMAEPLHTFLLSYLSCRWACVHNPVNGWSSLTNIKQSSDCTVAAKLYYKSVILLNLLPSTHTVWWLITVVETKKGETAVDLGISGILSYRQLQFDINGIGSCWK